MRLNITVRGVCDRGGCLPHGGQEEKKKEREARILISPSKAHPP
jgi:hypothetical protein